MIAAVRDDEFPGFTQALDLDRMLARLDAALPECRNGTSLVGGTVVDVRYRPGGPCWVLYNLKLKHDGGRSTRHLLSGQVLRAGDVPVALPSAVARRFRARDDSGLQTASVVLPDIPMVAYSFPVDESLPGLFDATDAGAMRTHLDALWHSRKVRVREVTPTVLGYTPHARAALAYDVLAEARGTAVPELRRLVGKMHAKKSAARIFGDAWALWRAAGGRVRFAPPVGYLPGVGLTLQERVEGTRLGGLVEDPSLPKWTRQVARMLSSLHAAPAPLSSRRRPEDEAQTVHRWAGVLLTIRQDLAAQVERLRDRIAAELRSLEPCVAAIHGDFHHTNILVHHDLVTFIDLDECALGDPMLDVGRFLASLRVPARRAFGRIDALQEAGEEFLQAYLRNGRGDERRARLFEAASLLIAGASAFRVQRPTWLEEVAELLAESETVLGQASRATIAPPDLAREDPRRKDPARWARDGILMQALLAPHLKQSHDVDLSECRVVKSGENEDARRVRYDVRGLRDGEPWSGRLEGVHKRGGSRSVLERVGEVSAALAGHPHALRLPQPVAYLGLLSLQVWEPPVGQRLASLIGTPDASLAAARLGIGLAALHAAPIGLAGAPRSLDHALGPLYERLALLSPEDQGGARRVLSQVSRWIHHIPAGFAATVRSVHPQHVRWDGTQVALARVDEIAWAHPMLDIADFLARTTQLELETGSRGDWAALAASCRDAYLAETGDDKMDLACVEAIVLLRLATSPRPSIIPDLPRRLIGVAGARFRNHRAWA